MQCWQYDVCYVYDVQQVVVYVELLVFVGDFFDWVFWIVVGVVDDCVDLFEVFFCFLDEGFEICDDQV